MCGAKLAGSDVVWGYMVLTWEVRVVDFSVCLEWNVILAALEAHLAMYRLGES
jgi:hypothetical protein